MIQVCVCSWHTSIYVVMLKSANSSKLKILVIHYVKNYPIPQVSNQKLSKSLKSDFMDRFFDVHLFMDRAENWQTITHNCDPWYQELPPYSKWLVRNHKYPLSMTSKTGCSWYTFTYAGVLEIGTKVKITC